MDVFKTILVGLGTIGLIAYVTKPSTESFITMIGKEGITGIPLIDKQIMSTELHPVFNDWIFFRTATIQVNEKNCDYFGFFSYWIR